MLHIFFKNIWVMSAITSGVSKDGSSLFPVMPYPYYNQMAPRDVKAIITNIRTLEPKTNEPPHPNSPGTGKGKHPGKGR